MCSWTSHLAHQILLNLPGKQSQDWRECFLRILLALKLYSKLLTYKLEKLQSFRSEFDKL